MQETITQSLAGMMSELARRAIGVPLRAIGARMSSQTMKVAALRIKGGSASPTVQTNAASVYFANGKLVTKPTATDMPALVGTVTNATFNVFAFFIDSAGTVTVAMGIAAPTLARVTFPQIAESRACIGFVIINPTGTGDFVGGTTALDDATVTPNAVIVDATAPFEPTILP